MMNMPDKKIGVTRHPRRGIYLLPTAFTLANLFCGYASLVQSANGALSMAAILIIVAGFLDALDGRIARLTGTTSEFGLQIDSAGLFRLSSWCVPQCGLPVSMSTRRAVENAFSLGCRFRWRQA